MLITKALLKHLQRLLYIIYTPFKDATFCVNVLQIFVKDLSSDIAKLKK